MAAPYSFTRRADGADQIIYAEHVNELQAAIEELGGLVRAPAITGNYYQAQAGGGSHAADTLTVDRLYFSPFYVGGNGFTADRIAIDVTTGAAGNARLGAYSASATTYLPSALLDDFGTIDTTTTGLKTITISETYSTTSTPIIWLAIVSNAAAIVRSSRAEPATSGLWGSGSGAVYTHFTGFYHAHAYAALPANASSVTGETFAPQLLLRAA